MALQYSPTVRNARLDVVESTIGTSAIARIYSGSKPAATTDAATGTMLSEMTLPSDWMAAASGGSKAKSGTWSDATANATGTAGYFRILDSTGTTTHIQGECTDTAGAGPLKLSTTAIVSGEPVTIVTFTLTEGNG
jgi:hypothetical protein